MPDAVEVDEFEGAVALVTGAGSGMGRASALAFGQRGCRVVVADIREEAAQETRAVIERSGGSALSVQVDVADERSVEELFDEVRRRFGRLDFAHNSAGVTDVACPTAAMTLARWSRVIDVNLTGTFLCLREELRLMIPAASGVIVNTSSGAGVRGGAGLPAYVASKHGVIGVTKSAAIEVASLGIRVNAILPGAVDTPMLAENLARDPAALAAMTKMHPIGRIGQPEEIAAAVLFLCSRQASFITGAALPVDGGVQA